MNIEQPQANNDKIELEASALLPALIGVDVLRRAMKISNGEKPTDEQMKEALGSFLNAASNTAATALHMVGGWPDADGVVLKFAKIVDFTAQDRHAPGHWFDAAKYAPRFGA